MNRVQFGVLALLSVLLLVGFGAPAAAQPIGTLEQFERITPQRWRMSVHSPAMGRDITIKVLRPADTSVPRPTLYLLNGAGAGADGANWMRQTDVEEFFADKNINVVIPVGGYFRLLHRLAARRSGARPQPVGRPSSPLSFPR